jgi:phosphotriesterase-related protein
MMQSQQNPRFANQVMSRRQWLAAAGAGAASLAALTVVGCDENGEKREGGGATVQPASTTPGPTGVPTPAVSTATGAVATKDLGFTLMHEHIFALTDGLIAQFPHVWDREERIRQATEWLRDLKTHGVSTIVDPSVMGNGRDVTLVREVAGASDVNVIVATGIYTYDQVPRYFQYHSSVDHMADFFVHDIEVGIQGTDTKAGILKVATDEQGMTAGVEMVLRAVARAHRRTGVPITTHTHARTERGLDQQRIFEEEGVDLSRVVIGHCGDTEDVAYLERLINAGSYIGMDRFGLDSVLPTDKRVATVITMCQRGHAERMVLSHDASAYSDWVPQEVQAAMPHWNFLHIPDDVIPSLRGAGVTGAQIEAMTVGNPRAIFERQGGY